MSAHTTVYYDSRAFVMEHPSNEDCIFDVWRDTQKFYEHDLVVRIARRNLAGVYMDVGANVGNHSVPFAALCPSTAVVCVEPFARVHDALRVNMTAHCGGKPWVLVPFAIGEKTERVSVDGWRESNYGTGRAARHEDGEAWSVPFGVLYEQYGPAVVLKLDTEGVELLALKQIAGRLASSTSAPVLIAVERVSPQEYADCDAYLKAFGYTCDGVDLAKPYAPVYLWEKTA